MDEISLKILKALSELKEPAGCGEIGKKADLPVPKVMGKLRSLSKEGLVESPVKGKYVITEKGRSALK